MSQLFSELRNPSEPGALRLKFLRWRRDARPVRFIYLPLLIAGLAVCAAVSCAVSTRPGSSAKDKYSRAAFRGFGRHLAADSRARRVTSPLSERANRSGHAAQLRQ